MTELKEGSAIRIHDDAQCNQALRGQLAQVDEVKSFGCVAFIDTFEGTIYVRLGSEDFTLCEEEGITVPARPGWVCRGCGKRAPGDAPDGEECCNPECQGEWGTGCAHCHNSEAKHVYKTIYKIEQRPEGWTKEQLPEGWGATDEICIVSIILPPDGSYSQGVMCRDGSGSGEEMKLEDQFKAFVMWGAALASREELDEGRRQIAGVPFAALFRGDGDDD